MIKTSIHCENCGNIGEYGFTENGSIEEVYESYYGGRCPICGEHHGGIYIESEMTTEEFVNELADMTPIQISKYAEFIHELAETMYT